MVDEQIVNKIKKMLALTQSNYEAEAETALLKAQQLMIQHGLTMADIQDSEQPPQEATEETIIHTQAPLWYGRIAAVLANNFRCYALWSGAYQNGVKRKQISFIGLPEDVAVVKEAYLYAIALVKHNIKCIKKRFPRVTPGYINTYIAGFINGLKRRFQEQVDQNNWGLILVKSKEVDTLYESYSPEPIKPRGPKPQQSKNQNAYYQGYQDGKSFDYARKRITS